MNRRGYWDDPDAFGVSVDIPAELKSAFTGETLNMVFATVLALASLKAFFLGSQRGWAMIEMKAMTWLMSESRIMDWNSIIDDVRSKLESD